MNCRNTKANMHVWKKHVPTHSHVLNLRIQDSRPRFMFGDHGTSYWHGETHNYGILCDEILVDFGGDSCCRGNFTVLSFLKYNLNTTADISIVMYSVYIFFSIYTVPNIMLNAEREMHFYIYHSIIINHPF